MSQDRDQVEISVGARDGAYQVRVADHRQRMSAFAFIRPQRDAETIAQLARVAATEYRDRTPAAWLGAAYLAATGRNNHRIKNFRFRDDRRPALHHQPLAGMETRS